MIKTPPIYEGISGKEQQELQLKEDKTQQEAKENEEDAEDEGQ